MSPRAPLHLGAIGTAEHLAGDERPRPLRRDPRPPLGQLQIAAHGRTLTAAPAGGTQGGPASSLSGVIGSSRIRRPVAWNTASATAASTPVAPSSPMPLPPIGLACSSTSSMNADVDVGGDVGVDRQRDAGQVLRQPAAQPAVLVAGLHRRLAPAPDDPADHLRASRARIDDPTDAVAARRRGAGGRSQLGVEPDLDEYRAERVQRVWDCRRRAERADADQLLDTRRAHRRRQRPGSGRLAELLARALAQLLEHVVGGGHHRGADAHRRRRPECRPGLGQRRCRRSRSSPCRARARARRQTIWVRIVAIPVPMS